MPSIDKKDICAVIIDEKTVCMECVEDEEYEAAAFDQFRVRDDFDEDLLHFCSRCKRQL